MQSLFLRSVTQKTESQWTCLQELEHPEAMYRALGTKLVVGMPFKDIATSDSIFLRSLPDPSDKSGNRSLRRLQVKPLVMFLYLISTYVPYLAMILTVLPDKFLYSHLLKLDLYMKIEHSKMADVIQKCQRLAAVKFVQLDLPVSHSRPEKAFGLSTGSWCASHCASRGTG